MSDSLRIVIALPTAGMVPAGFAYSLAGMVTKVAAEGLRTIPEKCVELSLDVAESSVWITNREVLVRRAIDNDRTHIMFIDDDMIFEPTILDVLAGRRQPIVVTNYLIKTTPAHHFVAMDFDDKTRIATRDRDTGLREVAYSGFGVSLIETRVFASVPQPWFLPDFDASIGRYTTEDNPCFRKLRGAGWKVYLDHDASKLVSHIGRKAWNWTEWVQEPKQNANDTNDN